MELLFDHTSNLKSPDEKKKAVKRKMAWRILVIFALIFLLLLIFVGNTVGAIYSYWITFLASLTGMVYLYVTKNPDPLFSFGSLAGSLIAQFSAWFVMGASHYVDMIWIIISSVVAYLGAGRKYATILLIFNAFGIGYYIYFVQNDHFKYIQQIGQLEATTNYLEIVLAFFILGYILHEFMGFQENWEKAYRETNVHLQSKNQTIEMQNNQNIVLIKEIHHRVKNNLQIIVSLLRLQKHELDNEEAKTQFQEAINRVIVMSSIHQKLYRQDDFTHINLQSHLMDLIQDVKSLFDHHKEVQVKVDCRVDYVDLKTMVPLGLLINELLSNSFKYAFINRNNGSIYITIQQREEGFSLVYTDNGLWIGDADKRGFGVELIEVFTHQLNGERTFTTNSEGTRYTFDLEYADQELSN